MSPFLSILLVSLLSTSIVAGLLDETDKYKSVGSPFSLYIVPKSPPITSIIWKHNRNLAAEWFGEGHEIEYYREFQGRSKLNIKTGELIVSNATKEFSGAYSLDINNKEAGSLEIRVIDPVPKPQLLMKCEKGYTTCVLTCEADITDTEFVSYKWELGSKLEAGNKTLEINEETEATSIVCVLRNYVSEERSESVKNPFRDESKGNPYLWSLLLLPLIPGIIVGLLKKDLIKEKFCSGEPKPKDNEGAGREAGQPLTETCKDREQVAINTEDCGDQVEKDER